MPPQFQRYVGIDYSGAQTPTSSLPGLRVYVAGTEAEPREISPPSGPKKYWTRRGVTEWLIAQLGDGISTIIGIDHAFSFPLEYFRKYSLPHRWDDFLEDFCQHWPTDGDHMYVDFVRDGHRGNGAARVGNTRWRRRTEELSPGAKSVFFFDVQGSVAKSSHSGIPWLRSIRRQLGPSIHFWPFDGWDVPLGRSAVVEVYPRLWNKQFPSAGRTGDQQDAYAVAAWLRAADANGDLQRQLSGPSSLSDREIAPVEGWILGVESNDAKRPRVADNNVAPRSRALVASAQSHPVRVVSGWEAIHLALIAASHALRNGQTDLAAVAEWAGRVAEDAGYTSHADQRRTRFTALRITRFQTLLYAHNERVDWRFPDVVLLVGWLLECGGPAMGRGPATADFVANGVRLMIGGTRWRYNKERFGHGGEGLPESREYQPPDCAHMSRGASA